MYARCGTQLRTGPAGFVGFDYLAVRSTCDALGVAVDEDLLWRIRAIEGFILERQAEDFKRARRERPDHH